MPQNAFDDRRGNMGSLDNNALIVLLNIIQRKYSIYSFE